MICNKLNTNRHRYRGGPKLETRLRYEIPLPHRINCRLKQLDSDITTADQRITLDLDDGVKVNYGKFGSLLAEVKEVHGKTPKAEVLV